MRVSSLFATALLVAGPLAIAAAAEKSTTHEQVKEIPVKGDTGGITLQTLCLGGDGNVVALVAPPRYGAKPKSAVSEVQVFTPAGEPVRRWKMNFTGQSINGGPDGSVYAAGDGRIAKFDKDGKPVSEVELPQVAALLKDPDKLRKKAKEQLDQEIESYDQMVKQFQDQKDRIKKKDTDDKLTQNEKAQLRALDQNLEVYQQIAKQTKNKSVDDVLLAMTNGLRTINALAVTDKDVFVVCGATKGHGYAVWRMDAEFKNAKEIIPSVIGCCGQMDIQARGDELFVAENCSHAVGKYTRDGKKLTTFGKKGSELESECFGGCCNPMNVRIAADGGVYTAESEGHIKLFDAKGKFVACVGTAALKGGCKNVAVAVSADGERVFFCDLPGSRVLVLAKKKATAAE
jgi:hypothetical protein